jgi:transposase
LIHVGLIHVGLIHVGLMHVGCWAHARRKFVDAVKVNPQDGGASRWSRAWMRCFWSIATHAGNS